MNKLACPSCGMPTIEDKIEGITFTEALCSACYEDEESEENDAHDQVHTIQWTVSEKHRAWFGAAPILEVRDQYNYVIARFLRATEHERQQADRIVRAMNERAQLLAQKAALVEACGIARYALLAKKGMLTRERDAAVKQLAAALRLAGEGTL